MRQLLSAVVLAGGLSVGAAQAFGGAYATEVVGYNAGTGVGAAYSNPLGALGEIQSQNSQSYNYEYEGVQFEGLDTSIITPFNAQFSEGRMVGIGSGGSLTLKLGQAAPTTGYTIGVHTAVGLSDMNWPSGQNGAVASTYSYRLCKVSVAELLAANPADTKWVDLQGADQLLSFDIPTNIYTDISSAYPYVPGTQKADFFKPFLGSLSDFDGKDWAGTLAVLDGSAGGTWLDLSHTGLKSVNYIRFDVPSDVPLTMYVDGVVAVPEPASLGGLLVSGLLLMRRRRA